MLAGNVERRIVTTVGRVQVVERNPRIVALDLHVEVVLEGFLDAVQQRHGAHAGVRYAGSHVCLRPRGQGQGKNNQNDTETFHGAVHVAASAAVRQT